MQTNHQAVKGPQCGKPPSEAADLHSEWERERERGARGEREREEREREKGERREREGSMRGEQDSERGGRERE